MLEAFLHPRTWLLPSFGGRFRGGFFMAERSRSLVIRTALALAGVVPGRRVGRGRDSIAPAVTHPAIHALPAFLSPAMLSFVAQVRSPQNLWTTNYDSTHTRSTRARHANRPSCMAESKILVSQQTIFGIRRGTPRGCPPQGIHKGCPYELGDVQKRSTRY
jgi:hypothetical protein